MIIDGALHRGLLPVRAAKAWDMFSEGCAHSLLFSQDKPDSVSVFQTLQRTAVAMPVSVSLSTVAESPGL